MTIATSSFIDAFAYSALKFVRLTRIQWDNFDAFRLADCIILDRLLKFINFCFKLVVLLDIVVRVALLPFDECVQHEFDVFPHPDDVDIRLLALELQ